MSDFNEAITASLRTWYPKDHDLHYNPHHPLGKLTGEWGELLDDYMKSIYKPGYGEFEPENELGDIWYYVRILAYQLEIEFRQIDKIAFPEFDFDLIFAIDSTEILISAIGYYASEEFISLLIREYVTMSALFISAQYSAIKEIGKRYNLTIDQLTESNWQKLKPGSERGKQWMKTDYVNVGKIGKLS